MNPYQARWWHKTKDNRFSCDLCPRNCQLLPGQKGFCFVREANEQGLQLTTYGRSSGFCIDPVEKKPLYHFLPGTPIFSFGTAGCNLGCKFCQNWDISKAKSQDRLNAEATPAQIAKTARQAGARSVAFTYNDPVIFAEYAMDTADECHALGLKTVAVTGGYISPQAREEFFAKMDAANIDLKGFTEDFYQKFAAAHLDPVLQTLEYVAKHTKTWLEITTLLIPGANDSAEEIERLTKWVCDHLGPQVPLHFSAFHPDFRVTDREPTPPATLLKAREIALKNGLQFVYSGNIRHTPSSTTYCPHCNKTLIQRDGYQITQWNLANSRCPECQCLVPGIFESQSGTWGSRRTPIQMDSV